MSHIRTPELIQLVWMKVSACWLATDSPLPRPLATTIPFLASMRLTFEISRMGAILQYSLVCDCLTSLRTISSRLTRVAAYFKISFCFKAQYTPRYMHPMFALPIYLPEDDRGQWCKEQGMLDSSRRSCFQFFWINTQKLDFWIRG